VIPFTVLHTKFFFLQGLWLTSRREAASESRGRREEEEGEEEEEGGRNTEERVGEGEGRGDTCFPPK
jgi:hypothetical protein